MEIVSERDEYDEADEADEISYEDWLAGRDLDGGIDQQFEALESRDRHFVLAAAVLDHLHDLLKEKAGTRIIIRDFDSNLGEVREPSFYSLIRRRLLLDARLSEHPALVGCAERIPESASSVAYIDRATWEQLDADIEAMRSTVDVALRDSGLDRFRNLMAEFCRSLVEQSHFIIEQTQQKQVAQMVKDRRWRSPSSFSLLDFPFRGFESDAPSGSLSSGFTPAFPIAAASDASPAVDTPATGAKSVPRIAGRPGKPTKRVRGGGPKPKPVFCDLFRDIRCGQLQNYFRSAEIDALNGLPKGPAPNLDAAVLVYQRRTKTTRHLDTIRRRCKQEVKAGLLDWEWDENDGPTCPPFNDDDDAS